MPSPEVERGTPFDPPIRQTRMGTVDLKIPKLREGSYMPSFLDPRRRWE